MRVESTSARLATSLFVAFQDYSLSLTAFSAGGTDVLGTAYETIVGATFRGELGSYFTPRTIADFVDVWRRMVPAGHARIFLARFDGELIAGDLFFIHGDTMLYYQGASTRDRAHTLRQAPAACFWAAIRAAKAMGLRRFDFGGCTPTDDPNDPRYGVWEFKKKWGGTLETFYNAEVLLSPRIVALQERVMAPLWQRVHPLLWRLTGRMEPSAA